MAWLNGGPGTERAQGNSDEVNQTRQVCGAEGTRMGASALDPGPGSAREENSRVLRRGEAGGPHSSRQDASLPRPS